MNTQDWLIYFLTGPLLVILALIFKLFPPKKINQLYGYRTFRSMKSQEAWDFANRYANNLMFWIFLGMAAVELPLYLYWGSHYAALISTGLMVVGIVALVISTEKQLKNRSK